MKHFTILLCLFVGISFGSQSYAQTLAVPKVVGTTVKKESITTGSANAIPLAVAVLALITSAGSLLVSLLLKNKDYKNDYYKKVIDKRIKAIEKIEIIISMFSVTSGITREGRPEAIIHEYFAKKMTKGRYNDTDFDIFSNNIHDYAVWCREETMVHLSEFSSVIIGVLRNVLNEQDREVQLKIFANNFNKIERQRHLVEYSLARDMRKLYDVDEFLKEKISIFRDALGSKSIES